MIYNKENEKLLTVEGGYVMKEMVLKNLKKEVIALVVSMFVLIFCKGTPVLAAEKFTGYTISSGNTTVYTGSKFRTKRGTIFGTDEVTILKVTDSYIKVKYPVSGGTKTGFIPRSALAVTFKGKLRISTASVTTYKRNSTKLKYGSISYGDEVGVFGTKGNFTQIKYPVSYGYKLAWVRTSDANKYFVKKSKFNNSVAKTNLSYALYKNSAAYISCGFDGYTTTSGKHEGIDIRYGNGRAVYALTDGVVTRVTFGSTGSYGLSTIAIYYANANKTIIYLHTAPLSSVYVGKSISRGQQIATESWRGVSSSSSSHTHVEVRNGKQTAACKSVGDYKLENSNPTSFWNSIGYNVK